MNSQMVNGYSHCAIGFINMVVFSISPAINASSHIFPCVLLQLLETALLKQLWHCRKPLSTEGNQVKRAGEERTEGHGGARS